MAASTTNWSPWPVRPSSFIPTVSAMLPDKAVTKALNSAKGYIFPAEEDFGIVRVEALAAGAPVIGFGKGGTLDIVQDGESGVLFSEQNRRRRY